MQRLSGHLIVSSCFSRFLPLNPNMDNPNFQLIRSPGEITSISCVFICLLYLKFTQLERILLGTTFFSNKAGGTCIPMPKIAARTLRFAAEKRTFVC